MKNEISSKNAQISKITTELNNQNKSIDEYKDLIKEEKNKNKELEDKYNELLSTKSNPNNIPMNSIDIINSKLKVNTIDATRTKSANRTMFRNKKKFLIQTEFNKELSSMNPDSKTLQTQIDTDTNLNKEQDLE